MTVTANGNNVFHTQKSTHTSKQLIQFTSSCHSNLHFTPDIRLSMDKTVNSDYCNKGLAEAKFVGLWSFQIIYSFINIFWIWLCAFWRYFLPWLRTNWRATLEWNKSIKIGFSTWHCLLKILAILCAVLPWRRACLCVHFSPSVPRNIGDALNCDQLWNVR